MTTPACGGENRELRLGAASGRDYEEVSVMYKIGEIYLCMQCATISLLALVLMCMFVDIKSAYV